VTKLTPKKLALTLGVRTFKGKKSGIEYLVFRTSKKRFHVFVEVQNKEAAIDCGSGLARKRHTHYHWSKLWK